MTQQHDTIETADESEDGTAISVGAEARASDGRPLMHLTEFGLLDEREDSCIHDVVVETDPAVETDDVVILGVTPRVLDQLCHPDRLNIPLRELEELMSDFAGRWVEVRDFDTPLVVDARTLTGR